MAEDRKDYFFWNRAFFEEAVKRRICSRCEHFDAEDVCHTSDPRGCALFRYLPELVIIAQHLEKPRLGSYVEEVRRSVKMECANPDPGLPCQLNDTLECGLQRHLLPLLKVVLQTDRCLEARSGYGDYDY